MDVAIGKIYQFEFKNEFEILGITPINDSDSDEVKLEKEESNINKGIYKVQNILSFAELQLIGFDVVKKTYVAVGLEETRFLSDLRNIPTMQEQGFYKLVSPTDEFKVYYIPEYYIKIHPEVNITPKECLMIVADIGPYGDFTDPNIKSEYLMVLKVIDDILTNQFGIKSNPHAMVYDTKYLTDKELAKLEADRAELKKNSTSINYYSECMRLKKLVSQLQNKINILEQMVGKQ